MDGPSTGGLDAESIYANVMERLKGGRFAITSMKKPR
jgi:hypothetical protein